MKPLDPSRLREPLRKELQPRSHKTAETARLYVAVCAGSIIGSVLRGFCSFAAPYLLGPSFPWGTLFVNVAGSFVIGFYATMTGPGGRAMASTRQRQFVMTGICGGFTTFSMFSLETLTLAQNGKWLAALLNVAVSVVTWLAAVWFGHACASRLNRLGGS